MKKFGTKKDAALYAVIQKIDEKISELENEIFTDMNKELKLMEIEKRVQLRNLISWLTLPKDMVLVEKELNKKRIKRYEQMGGRKITHKDKLMYENILSIQKELEDKHGRAQKSSLNSAVIIYSQREKLYWDENKINSVRVSTTNYNNTKAK